MQQFPYFECKMIIFFIFIISLQKINFLKIDLSSTIASDIILDDIQSFSFNNIPFYIPTMKLCFGTPDNQCFQLVINTISVFTVIEALGNNHFNNQFNTELSTSFNGNEKKRSFKYSLYWTYHIYGREAEDYIHIDYLTLQRKKFNFVLMDFCSSISNRNFDGYIGIYPIKEGDKNQDFSFIHYLFNTGVIENEIIALSYYNNGTGTAYLGEDIVEDKLCNASITKGEWSCKIESILLGEKVFAINNIMTFDSTHNFIVAPEELGGKFILNHIVEISKGKCEINKVNDVSFLSCNEDVNIADFPNIHLKTSIGELILQWKNMFKLHPSLGYYVSTFVLYEPNYLSWRIGIPGFINNVIVFDLKNKTIYSKYFETMNLKPLKKLLFTSSSCISFFGLAILMLLN